MINPQHLRPGNWIYPTGRSRYVVVTGLLLGMMEKNAELCESFEGIELTGELLYTISVPDKDTHYGGWLISITPDGEAIRIVEGEDGCYWPFSLNRKVETKYLHQLQNLYFTLTGSELSLPESAKIVPEGVQK